MVAKKKCNFSPANQHPLHLFYQIRGLSLRNVKTSVYPVSSPFFLFRNLVLQRLFTNTKTIVPGSHDQLEIHISSFTSDLQWVS